MPNIEAVIYTVNPIGKRELGEKILKLFEKNHLAPQKIGLFEPLKLDYTFEQAIEMLTFESNGCYIEGLGNTGKAGGMLGKSKNPKIILDITWWESPKKVYVNYIALYFPIKTFREYKAAIENIFRETALLVNGVYGYITHDVPLERQHVTGTIQTRLPGIFWCNYFGEKYVHFFGEEKINNFPWFHIEKLNNGGIITYLASEPDKELLKSTDLEMQAKLHLGIDSFGDVESYQANQEEFQIKNVIQF